MFSESAHDFSKTTMARLEAPSPKTSLHGTEPCRTSTLNILAYRGPPTPRELANYPSEADETPEFKGGRFSTMPPGRKTALAHRCRHRPDVHSRKLRRPP
jgi:hypothetical protein